MLLEYGWREQIWWLDVETQRGTEGLAERKGVLGLGSSSEDLYQGIGIMAALFGKRVHELNTYDGDKATILGTLATHVWEKASKLTDREGCCGQRYPP
jgi:hypothetical protein